MQNSGEVLVLKNYRLFTRLGFTVASFPDSLSLETQAAVCVRSSEVPTVVVCALKKSRACACDYSMRVVLPVAMRVIVGVAQSMQVHARERDYALSGQVGDSLGRSLEK